MALRTLRLRRDTAAQRQRLAAARRTEDLAGSPARASIGAIEIELRALQEMRGGKPDPPRAAFSTLGL